ncbi:MAG: PHP domain-containing protein [Clostridia bacterium]|nr:PHP domain-containing protein [Clostridia bacterium]MBR5427317.1 PHP domain-containing protein [Clostridia bacterium]
MKGDLHCHTKLSDGSVGLEELVMLAAKRGVDVISIMDIDSLAGTVRGKMIGKKMGVEVVPGVDLSATDPETGKEIHILCYQPDFPDRLEGLCHENQTARKSAGQRMMFKTVAKFGLPSDFIAKRSNGSANLFPSHIMHALMDAGHTDRIYGELYGELFGEGSPSSILTKAVFKAPEDVIGAIHDAGGLAIYANPAVNDSFETLERLLPMLDGIEVEHPSCSETDKARLLKIAKENKLLVTGGTDFRGMYNVQPIQIGDCSPTDKQLDEFLNYKARKKRQQKRAENKAAALLTTAN